MVVTRFVIQEQIFKLWREIVGTKCEANAKHYLIKVIGVSDSLNSRHCVLHVENGFVIDLEV